MAVSVAVHAAVVAIAVSADAPLPLPAPTVAPHLELVPPAPTPAPNAEPAPIEVTLLDDASAGEKGDRPHLSHPLEDARAASENGDRPHLSHPPAVAMATGKRDRPRFPPPARTGEPTGPGRNSLFDMRRGTPSLQALGVGRATDYGAALDEVAPPGTGA